MRRRRGWRPFLAVVLFCVLFFLFWVGTGVAIEAFGATRRPAQLPVAQLPAQGAHR